MNEIIEIAKKWKEALSSGNTDNITGLYDKEAVLWGTLSPIIRNTPELIREYFLRFATLEGIQAEFHEAQIRHFGQLAIHTGYYTFSGIENGKKISDPGRYYVVYKLDKDCKIIDHHSSVIPEQPFDLSKYMNE